MKEEEYSKDEEREQFLRWFEAGRHMRELRGDRSLAEVSKAIELSPNYISAVERGRVPSDHYIQVAASYFDVDEDDLFIMWGKVPILTRDLVQENVALQRSLAQISRDRSLSDEEKEKMYDEIYKTIDRYLKRKEAKK